MNAVAHLERLVQFNLRFGINMLFGGCAVSHNGEML